MTWNKGIDILVEAFLIMRKKYSHIKLILKDLSKLYGINGQSHITQLIQAKPHLNQDNLFSSFIFINENLSLSQLRNLYCVADCYVSPYRAEGFNLTVLEALACGSDVIVTQGGATDDFCEDNSIGMIRSVRTLNIELNKSRHYSKNQGHFLEPDLDSLVELMEKRINNDVKVNYSVSEMMKKRFTWSHAAEKIYNLI
jgi:glycosyltransferase involved in cell wall biosynthesis